MDDDELARDADHFPEAEAEAEADEDGVPGLGSDILAIRMRALRARSSAPGLEALEPLASHQIDLNSESHLTDLCLEDPSLAARMDERRRLAELESIRTAGLPPLKGLRSDDQSARQGLSRATLALAELEMALRCVTEEVLVETNNVEKLAAGGTPHGYPALPLPSKLSHLQKKLAAAGKALGEAQAAVKQISTELTVARRLHDASTSGLIQWADAITARAGAAETE